METEESTTVSNCEELSNGDKVIVKDNLSKHGNFNEMENECVGVSEVDGDKDDGDGQPNPPGEKERCVVCQKIITSDPSHEGSSSGYSSGGPSHGKEVPKAAVRSSFLTSLNGIWPYLQTFWRKQKWDSNEDEDNENDVDWSRVFSIENQRSKIFFSVPAVCQLCADKVQAVSDLMQGLKSHLRELRKIILESKRDNSQLFSEEVRCPKEEIVSESDNGSLGQLEGMHFVVKSKIFC